MLFSEPPNKSIRLHTNARTTRSTKQELLTDESTFSDLRRRWPPIDPRLLCQQYHAKAAEPEAPADTNTFKFTSPPNISVREARWCWWMEMARAGFFVQQLYLGTAFYQYHNCNAGLGTLGQCVIYPFDNSGTILWMYTTQRLYSPCPKGDMYERLAVIFPPWVPTVDGSQTFIGRWPAAMPTTHPAAPAPLDFSLHRH